MSNRYVYSLNGEDYGGDYQNRAAAESAALAAANRATDPPPSVFVGRAVEADPGANGHARALLARMGHRHGGSARLSRVSAGQIEELDAGLEVAVLAWMDKHQLMPNFFHVEAISEIPVPSANPR